MPATTSRAFMALCLAALFSAVPQGLSAQQATPETPAVVIDGSVAETLLGKPVQSAKGEDLGRIVDVIVDRAGLVRAAIIDFGGFLGVGTRKIAVDWRVLRFGPPSGKSSGLEKLIADLPRDQLRKAPVYKEGEPIVIMGGTPPSPAPAPETSTNPPAPGTPPSPAPAPETSTNPPAPDSPTPKP
jgi:PRC-barrel domain